MTAASATSISCVCSSIAWVPMAIWSLRSISLPVMLEFTFCITFLISWFSSFMRAFIKPRKVLCFCWYGCGFCTMLGGFCKGLSGEVARLFLRLLFLEHSGGRTRR